MQLTWRSQLLSFTDNMGGASKKRLKPVQGGFLVLRPDMEVYKEFVEIIRKGDFREGGGWGGKTGVFYGSMTFQGIIPYFYDVLHPDTAVELNHCVFNQMADNPREVAMELESAGVSSALPLIWSYCSRHEKIIRRT